MKGWLAMLLIRVRAFIYGRPRPRAPAHEDVKADLPQEVRAASHELANEVHMLNVHMRRIQQSLDPLDALVKSARRARQREENKRQSNGR